MKSAPTFARRLQKKTLWSAAAALLAGSAWFAPAAAQPGPRGPGACAGCCGHGPAGMQAHRHASRMLMQHRGGAAGFAALEKLDLTEAQRTKLREIRRRGPSTLMPKQQVVAEARLDFQDVMAKKDASTAEIRQAHEKLARARADLQSARFDLRLQAREVLTPEQREKLRKDIGGRGRGQRQSGLDAPFDVGMGPEFDLGPDLDMGPEEMGPELDLDLEAFPEPGAEFGPQDSPEAAPQAVPKSATDR